MEAMDAVDREDAEREVVNEQNCGVGGAHAAALIVLFAAAASAPPLTARYGFGAFVTAYVISIGAWLIVRRRVLSRRATIVIAIALRALFLFATPQLSGDVYRYLWDGRTLAAGHNPYTRLPDDPRINHPEIPTIYPPHAELLFAAVHWLPAWRLPLIGADLATIVLTRRRSLAYATFPPLLFEGAWSGHIESLAAMLLALAATRDSGAAAGAAVGVKIIPAAAVPLLFVRARRRMRWALAFALLLVVPAIPFAVAGPLMPGMRAYATRWIFNSPLYSATFAVVDALHVAERAKSLFTSIKDRLHLEPIAHAVYFHLYADYVTRMLLGGIAVAAIAIFTRRRSSPAAPIAALLLCSPAIHPWYWIVLAPFASGLALWLALCAPFSYLLYVGASPWLVFALCYALPLALSARFRSSAIAT